MITWITRDLALAIHDRQLAEHGGGTGVRDEALLDSALARAKTRERRLFLTAGVATVVVAAAVLGPLGRWLGTGWAVWGLRLAVVAVAAGAGVLLWRKRPRQLFASEHVPQIIGLEREGQHSSVQTAAEFLAWKEAVGAPSRAEEMPWLRGLSPRLFRMTHTAIRRCGR